MQLVLWEGKHNEKQGRSETQAGFGSRVQLKFDLSKEIRECSCEKDKCELRFEGGEEKSNSGTWRNFTQVQSKDYSEQILFKYLPVRAHLVWLNNTKKMWGKMTSQ